MSDDADNDNDHGPVLGDRHVALDDVVTACHAAQETHARAAELVEDGAEALRRLAGERAAQYEALTAAMRDANLLPKAPDPDRETVEALIDRAAVLISGDRQQAAKNRSDEAERHLADALAAARRYDHDPAIAGVLERMSSSRPR